MKKIVVPFDFSSYALAALKTAQKIAIKSGAEITCITVIPSEVDWEKLSEKAKLNYPDLLQEYQEAKEVLPEHLGSLAPGKAVINLEIRIGMPNELILRVIEEQSADMVVLGAYGKGYTGGNFIGSTLQKVLRKTSCPVLAVKEALNGNDFRKLIFASDFRSGTKNALTQIKPLLKAFRSSVHLLFVNTPGNFHDSPAMKEAMRELMQGNEELVFHQHIFNDHEVEKGVIAFAKEQKASWVAVLSGSRTSSSSYLIGTTETLIYQGDLGVLSLKN